VSDFKALLAATLHFALTSEACAEEGMTEDGQPLAQADVAWYTRRAQFWNSFHQDMLNSRSSVNDGTYKITPTFQEDYLGISQAVAPLPPMITGKLSEGMVTVSGKVQPVDVMHFPNPPQVYICVWPSQPIGNSLDCLSKETHMSPAVLSGEAKNGVDYVLSASDGSFSAQLKEPLSGTDFVSVVEVFNPGKQGTAIASVSATAVGPASQCNRLLLPYGDCDLSLSIIGGVEQSAQSSSQVATTGFLRVFSRTPLSETSPKSILFKSYIWGYIRLLGSPTTSSTSGVVSVVSNPSGSVTTQTFSTIGNAIDYSIGAEYQWFGGHKYAYSTSIIVGYGGTTPLEANTLSLAFAAPSYGTVECPELYSRFQSQFVADRIFPGTTTNSSPISCLVNGNSPVGAGTPVTYTPITTIGFSNQDRTSFLGKGFIGIRTIDRFHSPGTIACGTADPVNRVGPCERGIVDFTFGQDASITGGQMRHFIFKVDAVHPLTVERVKLLYLFGSMSIRLTHNSNLAPLILQSTSVSALTGAGGTAIPNPSTIVLSLVQPNRDFYRFGAGLNISQIFTNLFSARPGTGSQ
jgi:hypothetical protein